MVHGAKLSLVVAMLAACSERETKPPPPREPPPPRRVIEPPTGTVRPLPPYTIKAEGVGPYYTLNETIPTLLQQLPSGPRITRFEIPGVVRTNVIRAEDDNVLIGGETYGTPQFIAVVAPDVARTEAGIEVGSKVSAVAELGSEELERVRDPRLVCSAALKNVKMIVDDGKIAAFVVAAETPLPQRKEVPTCTRPKPTVPRTFGSCLTGAGEIVEIEEGQVSIYLPEADRKPIATLRIPNVVFAGALHNPIEGRDELVAISRSNFEHARTWTLTAFRVESKQFVRVVDSEPLYSLSTSQARWIGAELANVDLYLELTHRSDGIEVGGLLTSWRGEKIRDVAVISPVVVTRRGGKSSTPSEPGDAGVDAPVSGGSARSGAGSAVP